MVFQSLMCHLVTIAIIFTYFPCTIAIRVDWNTNHGPIIPATSTLPPVPTPPFREPAPAWEDQSNDLPNPNEYKYIAPPPSRPRLNNPDDIQTKSDQHRYDQLSTTTRSAASSNQESVNGYSNQIPADKKVSSLGIKYIPNYGNKYISFDPRYEKAQYLNYNDIYSKYDKLNGKYNPKLKKYKAYEQKVKFVPFYKYYLPKQPYIY